MGVLMKIFISLLSSLSLMLLLTACETTRSRNNQFASPNQDIIRLQNNVVVLNRKIVSVQKNNLLLANKIASLKNQTNYINEANQQQDKTIRALNQQLAKERAERKVAMNKVVETVAAQTSNALNKIAKQSRPKATRAGKTIPAGAYYKHKVGAGETLSAIARAYKVSVKDIKKTNNLKSNIIGIGQILHIPKK